jgi:hypothetical protein
MNIKNHDLRSHRQDYPKEQNLRPPKMKFLPEEHQDLADGLQVFKDEASWTRFMNASLPPLEFMD